MIRFHFITRLVLLAGILMLAGCNPQAHQPPNQSTKQQHPSHAITSSNGCFTASSNWHTQAKVNDYFFFDITLSKSCIAPQHIGAITVYADMPAHGHGTNSQAVVKNLAPLVYRIEGMLLHMPGAWLITLEIPYTKQNQNTLETIQFNATL